MNTDTPNGYETQCMTFIRNVVEVMASEFFGPESGVIIVVSHEHPDDAGAGRARVISNMGNDVAARLLFEMAEQYARVHGLDFAGARVYVSPEDDLETQQ